MNRSAVAHRHARSRYCAFVSALLCALLAVGLLSAAAAADPLADDGGAEWQVEQPLPPSPVGAEPSEGPDSLGHIGDIEFYEPDRGALITSGNGGSVKPGVWFYDGVSWTELSTQCGATDGRIAWAGPDEFWTVSDGRAGQANASNSERPPLEDNTLCHFAPGPPDPEGHRHLEIVASYASVPFLGSSYQAMHAAACFSPSDCWFGGEPLPAPEVGVFMLHWNGATVERDAFLPEGHPVWSMVPYERSVYEAMRLQKGDRVEHESLRPPALRAIHSEVVGEESPFEAVPPESHLLYSPNEFSAALDYLRLSTSEGSLWAAAGPQVPGPPQGSREAGITILRKPAGEEWQSVIGPQEGEDEQAPPPGQILFPHDVLNSIAAEPGTASAWIAIEDEQNVRVQSTTARAALARVSSEGGVSDRLELPLPEDPHGPLGSARQVVCPAVHDCWAATSGGWLLHLATQQERERPTALVDSVFARIQGGEPITFRPADEGVPQEAPDEVPEDNSGESVFTRNEELVKPPKTELARTRVPLLSNVHARVIHRDELVLSFHLAVKAKVRLLALRRKKVIARTAMRTLRAGKRQLSLRLDPRHWPQSLKLQTHALEPLPTRTSASPHVNAISTSFVDPARLLAAGLGS